MTATQFLSIPLQACKHYATIPNPIVSYAFVQYDYRCTMVPYRTVVWQNKLPFFSLHHPTSSPQQQELNWCPSRCCVASHHMYCTRSRITALGTLTLSLSSLSQSHLHGGHLTMRDCSAHVVTLRETHVRDAVGSCSLAPRAFSAAGALGVVGVGCCCGGMLVLLCLVLRREQHRRSEIVHSPTEQIYVVDTMQVDRLGKERGGGEKRKQGAGLNNLMPAVMYSSRHWHMNSSSEESAVEGQECRYMQQ